MAMLIERDMSEFSSWSCAQVKESPEAVRPAQALPMVAARLELHEPVQAQEARRTSWLPGLFPQP
jgi:hypothetical protein